MGDDQSENSEFKYTPTDSLDEEKSDIPAEEHMHSKTSHFKEDKHLLHWSAPDSLSSSKNTLWYLLVIVVTLAVAVGIYFATKDKITTGVIVVSGLLFSVYAAKKPKIIDYQLSRSGFMVNGKEYNFGSYRSFAIIARGDMLSAVFTPLKRFMPYMYIYFGRDMENKITSTLTDILPKESRHGDLIDRALRRIGF